MPFLFVTALYLIAALVVEMALLPPLREALPAWTSSFFDMHLLALAGVVAGLLRGEVAGALTALAAALCFGFAVDPTFLGPAIVSFGLVGLAAGLAARRYRISNAFTCAFTILVLLVAEGMIWSLARKLFWSQIPLAVPWLGILTTALVGALLYRPAARPFKKNLFEQ